MEFFDEIPGARPFRQRRIDWEKVKAALKDNPGRWGLMAEDVSSSTASQLRKGANRLFRGDELNEFEFRVRKPDGEKASDYVKDHTDLYGRYVPAESQPE